MAAAPSTGLFVIFSLLVASIKAENLQTGQTLKSLEHRRLFVFGDSFADTGNKQNPDEPYYSLRKPYGETYPLYPTGRWSDGKVMTDFVATYMDLISPVPYTKRNDSIMLQRYGMNFAYGGTGVFDTFTGLPEIANRRVRTADQQWALCRPSGFLRCSRFLCRQRL
ncbi:GDSL esterase/lipase At3g09930-like [Nymphaea colorata]|nr:GDSL esterase/lipase At3g09930-like [Nymphaea colorata]